MKDALKSIQVKMFLVFFCSVILLSLTQRINDSYGIIDYQDGNIVILLTLLTSTIFYSVFLAEYDSDKTFTSHFSRAIFRIVLFSFLPVILVIQQGEYNNILLIYYQLTLFYIFFEISYNSLTDHDLFYVGTTSINDKVVNYINRLSFMKKIYPAWYIVWKVILFISSIYLIKIYWL